MAVQILQFTHPRFAIRDFGIVIASTREISRFGGGPLAHSFGYFSIIRRQSLRYAGKARRKLQRWSRRLTHAELRTEHRHAFVNDQIHREAVLLPHPPTTVMRTTSSTEPSLIKLISTTQITLQAHHPLHKHGPFDQTNLGEIVGGRAHKICGIKDIIPASW